VRVEVPRARVTDILEELHEEERRLGVRRAEAEVLVVAARRLIVQVDVEELPGLPRLRDRVREVEARHLLVRHLGVHADHVRVSERRNQPEVVARRRHVDVAAGLVRLGFHREPVAVLPVDRVVAQIVDRVTAGA
jgi:hypothetical protein